MVFFYKLNCTVIVILLCISFMLVSTAMAEGVSDVYDRGVRYYLDSEYGQAIDCFKYVASATDDELSEYPDHYKNTDVQSDKHLSDYSYYNLKSYRMIGYSYYFMYHSGQTKVPSSLVKAHNNVNQACVLGDKWSCYDIDEGILSKAMTKSFRSVKSKSDEKLYITDWLKKLGCNKLKFLDQSKRVVVIDLGGCFSGDSGYYFLNSMLGSISSRLPDYIFCLSSGTGEVIKYNHTSIKGWSSLWPYDIGFPNAGIEASINSVMKNRDISDEDIKKYMSK